jgi:hypothetical protein
MSSNRVLGIFDNLSVPSTHHFKFTQRVSGTSSFLLTFFFLTVTSFFPSAPFLQALNFFFFSSFLSFVFSMCFQQFFLSVVVLPLYNSLNGLLCFALLRVLLSWALRTNSKLNALAILLCELCVWTPSNALQVPLFCEFCTLTPSNIVQVLLFWALCTNSKLSAIVVLFSWALCIESKWRSRGSSPLSFVHWLPAMLIFSSYFFCFFIMSVLELSMDTKIDYIFFTICIALLIDVFRKICFLQQKL